MIPTSDIIVQKNTEPESCNDRTDFLGAVIVLYFAVVMYLDAAGKRIASAEGIHKVFLVSFVINILELRATEKCFVAYRV